MTFPHQLLHYVGLFFVHCNEVSHNVAAAKVNGNNIYLVVGGGGACLMLASLHYTLGGGPV